ncbi:hypothetical protein J3E69DRAFT_362324 [Trichoderma sp. SZMC 28015]
MPASIWAWHLKMMGMGSIRGILSPLLVYNASPPAYCREGARDRAAVATSDEEFGRSIWSLEASPIFPGPYSASCVDYDVQYILLVSKEQ